MYLYQICDNKAVEISPNQDADLHRFLFTEDSLKIKKGPGTSFQNIFFVEFFDTNFFFVVIH